MLFAFDPLFIIVKTIQVMPAGEAEQFCAGEYNLQFGGGISPV